MEGYRVEIICVGEGRTEDDALQALIDDLFSQSQNLEHGSGEDFLEFEECELEE